MIMIVFLMIMWVVGGFIGFMILFGDETTMSMSVLIKNNKKMYLALFLSGPIAWLVCSESIFNPIIKSVFKLINFYHTRKIIYDWFTNENK